MYVQCNVESLSCQNCCSGKAVSIAYSECIQHEMRMYYIVICGLPNIFPHYLINGRIFEKKGY
jgi:hypothetical protein